MRWHPGRYILLNNEVFESLALYILVCACACVCVCLCVCVCVHACMRVWLLTISCSCRHPCDALTKVCIPDIPVKHIITHHIEARGRTTILWLNDPIN